MRHPYTSSFSSRGAPSFLTGSVIKAAAACAKASVSILILILGLGMATAEQPAVSVKAHLEPADVVNAGKAQLIVELQGSPSVNKFRLEIVAPPHFQVGPTSTTTLPPFQNRYTSSSFFIQRDDNSPPAVAPYTLVARVFSGDGSSNAAIAETSVTFNYVSRLSIPAYFTLGAIGILIGYAVRLFIQVLKVVPAPPLAPEQGPSVGPITGFVQKHYYLVDCSVTLVVGLCSLLLLIKNNHVPDSGLYWYSTLGTGVALGLLTNSELISKLR